MTNHVPPFLHRLGLPADANERDIKKAYARELKLIDQEKDLAGFQALREAFEHAKRWAQMQERKQEQIQAQTQTQEQTQKLGQEQIQEQEPKPQVAVATADDDALMTFDFNPNEQAEERPRQSVATMQTTAPRPAPPIAPQVDFFREQEADGDLACERFLAAIAVIPLTRGPQVEKAMREQLEAVLSEPRMVSLVARTRFEHGIAQFLASGWKPGSELLLNVAIAAFKWDADNQRLPAIPAVGRVLNQVLEERSALSQFPGTARFDVVEVLQRLRYGPEANEQDIVAHMYALEIVERRFPVLLRLTSNAKAVAQWHEAAALVPAKSCKKFNAKRGTVSSGSGSGSGGSKTVPWGLIIFIVVSALRGLHAFLPSFDSTAPEHFTTAPRTYSPPATDEVPPLAKRIVELRPMSHMKPQDIRQRVVDDIPYIPAPNMMNDDMAEFTLDLAPDGKIESLKQIRSSGNPQFDEAVGRAIGKTIPTLFHGDAPASLFLSFNTNMLKDTGKRQ
jgi:hypothetical protein